MYTATPISAIEETFRSLTNRDDIAIILINQHVCLLIMSIYCTLQATPSAMLSILSLAVNIVYGNIDWLSTAVVVCTNAQIAEEIRHLLNAYEKTIPTVLEIPSKDSPYDPSKDYIMKRVGMMLGENP